MEREAGADDTGNALYDGAVFDEVAVSLREKGFTPLDIDGTLIQDFGHRKDCLRAHRLQESLRARGLLFDEVAALGDSAGARHPKASSAKEDDGRGRLYSNSCAALLKEAGWWLGVVCSAPLGFCNAGTWSP